MALRGLLQTVAPGLYLLILGYGWLPMVSGIMMGWIYDIQYRFPKLNTIGTQSYRGLISEVYWGYWFWITIITAILLFRFGQRKQNSYSL